MVVVDSVAQAMLNSINAEFGQGCTLQLRSGAMPPITAPSSGSIINTFSLPDPVFAAASGRTLTANAISDSAVDLTGTIGHGEIRNSSDQLLARIPGSAITVVPANSGLNDNQNIVTFTVTLPDS